MQEDGGNGSSGILASGWERFGRFRRIKRGGWCRVTRQAYRIIQGNHEQFPTAIGGSSFIKFDGCDLLP